MERVIDYLRSLPHGGQAKLAKDAGLPPSLVSNIATGRKGVGLVVAAKLVRASNGALTLNDFVPAEHPAQSEPEAA